MINVVISLYYYLLILKAAYLEAPAEALPPLNISPQIKILAGGLIIVMVVAGIFPTYLIELASAAAAVLQ
jgi:NADH-quinone oxidoreductase subunit N